MNLLQLSKQNTYQDLGQIPSLRKSFKAFLILSALALLAYSFRQELPLLKTLKHKFFINEPNLILISLNILGLLYLTLYTSLKRYENKIIRKNTRASADLDFEFAYKENTTSLPEKTFQKLKKTISALSEGEVTLSYLHINKKIAEILNKTKCKLTLKKAFKNSKVILSLRHKKSSVTYSCK